MMTAAQKVKKKGRQKKSQRNIEDINGSSYGNYCQESDQNFRGVRKYNYRDAIFYFSDSAVNLGLGK